MSTSVHMAAADDVFGCDCFLSYRVQQGVLGEIWDPFVSVPENYRIWKFCSGISILIHAFRICTVCKFHMRTPFIQRTGQV